MKCKLSFDSLIGYIAQSIFGSFITLGISFATDWQLLFLTLITVFSLAFCLYLVLMAYDEKPKLIINEKGITIRNQFYLFAKPVFFPWSSIMCFDEWSDSSDDEGPIHYLVIINCVDGKKWKANLSTLDRDDDEILDAINTYRSKGS